MFCRHIQMPWLASSPISRIVICRQAAATRGRYAPGFSRRNIYATLWILRKTVITPLHGAYVTLHYAITLSSASIDTIIGFFFFSRHWLVIISDTITFTPLATPTLPIRRCITSFSSITLIDIIRHHCWILLPIGYASRRHWLSVARFFWYADTGFTSLMLAPFRWAFFASLLLIDFRHARMITHRRFRHFC